MVRSLYRIKKNGDSKTSTVKRHSTTGCERKGVKTKSKTESIEEIGSPLP